MDGLTTRWCPTHKRYEINPPGRLLCSAAWRELYAMEREVEAQKIGTANAILQLGDRIEVFANSLPLPVEQPRRPPPAPRPPPPQPYAPTTSPPANGSINL